MEELFNEAEKNQGQGKSDAKCETDGQGEGSGGKSGVGEGDGGSGGSGGGGANGSGNNMNEDGRQEASFEDIDNLKLKTTGDEPEAITRAQREMHDQAMEKMLAKIDMTEADFKVKIYIYTYNVKYTYALNRNIMNLWTIFVVKFVNYVLF